MTDDGERTSVLCVDATGEVGAALDGRPQFAVRRVDGPEAALAALADAAPECLVTTDPDRRLFEAVAAAAPSAPRVAYLDPDAAAPASALDRGATDVVTAAGPDPAAVLANRVETAVERAPGDGDQVTDARFEALTNNTNFAVVTIDEESVVQYASPAVEELFGYAPAELEGEPLTAVMPERFHETHHAAVSRYLETGERGLDWGWIEIPGQHRDGTEVPLGVSFGERAGEDEHRFGAVMRDISDRKEREERLDRLASAVEGSMDGVAILDEDNRFQYVNDAHADIYGYDDPDDLVGDHWRSLYEPEERERFEREAFSELDERGEWRGEATGRRADGSTFPQAVSLTRLGDGGMVCVVRNIGDRVERRRELREERQFVETVIDTLPDLFYVLDLDGTFRRWNDQFTTVTGYDDAELDGMHALEVIAPDDRERVTDAIGSVIERRETDGVRADLLTAEGDRIVHDFSGSPVTDADGTVVGLAGIGRDVSDERLREQRLAVLSRVLRHNVRNRTTVIDGRAEYVAREVDDPHLQTALSGIREAASDLASASDRARKVERIVREGRPSGRRVDLAAVVDRALADADTDGIDLRTDLPDGAPAVGTDAVGVAVRELVDNARRHVTDPTVWVSVERDAADASGADTVSVVVADDGPGIPEQERRVLSEGEESPLAHSAGMGLWLVKWVATTAGGQVRFRESEAGGAAVVLSFPAA